MRKKFMAIATAAALTIPAVQAPAAMAQGSSVEQGFKDIGQGIENAFNPSGSSNMDTPEGFGEKLIEPYKLGSAEASSGKDGVNLQASSQGITQAIINYVIIAAGVTLVGQIIQIIISNLPK